MTSANRDDRRDCASVVRDLWEYLDGRASTGPREPDDPAHERAKLAHRSSP